MTKEREEFLIKFCNPDERLNQECPLCGSKKVVFILYGLWDEEYDSLIDSGEAIPGGCFYGEHNLACRDCEFTWASIPDPEKTENK